MVDGQYGDLRLGFDRRSMLKFLGSKVTPDLGLFAHRELDEAPCLTEMAESLLGASRLGKNKHHGRVALPRQMLSICAWVTTT